MIACSLLVSLAAALFKRAVATHEGWALYRSAPLWAGVTCYMLSFVCNALALRDGAITLLLPLLELSVLWSALMAVAWFGERPDGRTIAGAALIVVGSVVLSMPSL